MEADNESLLDATSVAIDTVRASGGGVGDVGDDGAIMDVGAVVVGAETSSV